MERVFQGWSQHASLAATLTPSRNCPLVAISAGASVDRSLNEWPQRAKWGNRAAMQLSVELLLQLSQWPSLWNPH